MKEFQRKLFRGFTFLEFVIVIAVCLILSALAIIGMSTLSNKSSLSVDVGIVNSAILKARSMSINGVGGVEHGIYLASTSVTIFQGTNVNGANIDEVYNLSKSVITSISLSNATSSFYFDKVTGNPSAYGNLILNDEGASTTVTIYASGLSE